MCFSFVSLRKHCDALEGELEEQLLAANLVKLNGCFLVVASAFNVDDLTTAETSVVDEGADGEVATGGCGFGL